MKFIQIILLQFFCVFIFAQNQSEIDIYKETQYLQFKKDSLDIAYKYCGIPELKVKIKKIEKKINKLKSTIDSGKIEDSLFYQFYVGDSLLKQNEIDESCFYLRRISDLRDDMIIIKKIDYAILYDDLANIYIQKYNADSALFYFDKSLDFGNQNTETLTYLLCTFYSESKFYYNRIIGKMNRKLIETANDTDITSKILFRLIYLTDQLPRCLSYGKMHLLPIDFTLVSDSVNQHILSYLFDNNLLPKITDLGFDASTIDMVFIHAAVTNHVFFEKYFSLIASRYNNDFLGFNIIQFMFDLYLRSIYGTQYFGTVMGKLADGSYGAPPFENKETVREVFKKLRIDFKIP